MSNCCTHSDIGSCFFWLKVKDNSRIIWLTVRIIFLPPTIHCSIRWNPQVISSILAVESDQGALLLSGQVHRREAKRQHRDVSLRHPTLRVGCGCGRVALLGVWQRRRFTLFTGSETRGEAKRGEPSHLYGVIVCKALAQALKWLFQPGLGPNRAEHDGTCLLTWTSLGLWKIISRWLWCNFALETGAKPSSKNKQHMEITGSVLQRSKSLLEMLHVNISIRMQGFAIHWRHSPLSEAKRLTLHSQNSSCFTFWLSASPSQTQLVEHVNPGEQRSHKVNPSVDQVSSIAATTPVCHQL